MKNFGQGSPEIADYAARLFQPVDPLLQSVLQTETEAGLPEIHVGPMDGRHLEVLSRALQPQVFVEIGVLAGYSAICIGRGMAEGGVMYLFEKDPMHAAIAQRNIETFIKKERPDLKYQVFVGAALDQLEQLSYLRGIDLVFIDADKPNYRNYWNWAVERLKVGGVILADNTFAWGEVHKHDTSEGRHREMLKGLHDLNALAATDERVKSTILPTAEGLTMSVRI